MFDGGGVRLPEVEFPVVDIGRCSGIGTGLSGPFGVLATTPAVDTSSEPDG